MMQTLLQIGAANALLAAAAAVITALVGRIYRRPALTHALWLLVLLKLLTPPIVRIPFRIPSGPAAAARASQIDTSIARSVVQPVSAVLPIGTDTHDTPHETSTIYVPSSRERTLVKFRAMRRILAIVNLQTLLCIVWCAGSAVTAIVVFAGVLKFERLLKFLKPAPAEISERLGILSSRLRLQRPPQAYLIRGQVSPMLWAGFREPRLLLPIELWHRLDARQRDTVLLHELVHLRRRDHWARWLEAAATIAFWWFPVCWWARRELREAEEQCCDAWVVRMAPEHSRCYAGALLAAAEFVSTRSLPPLLASGIGQFIELKRRLTLIQRGNMPQAMGAFGVCAAVGFGMLLIPLMPVLSWASNAPDRSTTQSSRAILQSAAEAQAPSIEEHNAELKPDDLERRMNAIEARATEMLEEVRQLRSQLRSTQNRPSRE